jgi:succinate dehydrogenase / fumarate reductase flavoprotein subunit
VAAWEFTGAGNKPARHIEPLSFETVHPSVRSYK